MQRSKKNYGTVPCCSPIGALCTLDSGLGSEDLIVVIVVPLCSGIAGGFRRFLGVGGGGLR